jgi:intein-encoded DNA endonuclease-like protein
MTPSREELEELYWQKGLSLREIGEVYGVSTSTVWKWMRRLGVRPKGKPLQRPDLRPSGALAYLLGVLLGDGCTITYGRERRACLHAKDVEFVQEFCRCLNAIGLHAKYWRSKRGLYVAHATSKLFVEWFNSLSLSDVEALIRGLEADFIRGFYDSEGNLYASERKRYVYIALYNTRLELMELVGNALRRLGFEAKMRSMKVQPKGDPFTVYYIRLGGRQKVRDFIEKVKPSIPRKRLLPAWTARNISPAWESPSYFRFC